MTPEEIAREAAEGMVSAGPPTRVAYGQSSLFFLDAPGGEAGWLAYGRDCLLADLRHALAAHTLAAIERALRDVPVPGGPCGERLAEVRDLLRIYDRDLGSLMRGDPTPPLRDAIRDLLAHADHLTRALYDCGRDGSAAVWSAGYAAGEAAGRGAGAEAQRAAVAAAIREMADRLDFSPRGIDVRDGVLAALYHAENTPLAGPPG